MKGGHLMPERVSLQHLQYTKTYPKVGIETSWTAPKLSANHPRVQLSPDYCEMMVGLVFNICVEHVNWSMLFTHHYPRRQVCLLDETLSGAFLKSFREDLRLFNKLCLEGTFPGADNMIKRSYFNTIPVRQLVACLELEGWECTARTFGNKTCLQLWPPSHHHPQKYH